MTHITTVKTFSLLVYTSSFFLAHFFSHSPTHTHTLSRTGVVSTTFSQSFSKTHRRSFCCSHLFLKRYLSRRHHHMRRRANTLMSLTWPNHFIPNGMSTTTPSTTAIIHHEWHLNHSLPFQLPLPSQKQPQNSSSSSSSSFNNNNPKKSNVPLSISSSPSLPPPPLQLIVQLLQTIHYTNIFSTM